MTHFDKGIQRRACGLAASWGEFSLPSPQGAPGYRAVKAHRACRGKDVGPDTDEKGIQKSEVKSFTVYRLPMYYT